jgi:hypothetical protein
MFLPQHVNMIWPLENIIASGWLWLAILNTNLSADQSIPTLREALYCVRGYVKFGMTLWQMLWPCTLITAGKKPEKRHQGNHCSKIAKFFSAGGPMEMSTPFFRLGDGYRQR